ncbi:hypothetical protein DNH61_11900 [Paenibacillus sambharensis]|uniref:Arabinogalactan endo-beta-1,4-galactanase n=1 Tax=Paenibacillus sambharensis TaxID=1803190 RepID=A0A2W1LK22_9BACL|nr:glycosyl hydrolase 53 family protein [Paenibacillus sambharensis]PZD95255.1 hypothetical protein DNH61_11900 [Paenibacillus sambharensis]
MRKQSFLRKSVSLASVISLLTIPLFSTQASAYYGNAAIKPAVTNLTTKDWVSAQSNTGDPKLAIDQDLNTYWEASLGAGQNSVEIDLGGTYRGMRKVGVVFPSLHGEYRYKLEASGDGVSWFTLSDHSAKGITGGEDVLITQSAGIRYLKATLLGVSNGAIPGIAELRINNYVLKENLTVGADISWDTSFPNRMYTTQNRTDSPSSDGHMIGTMQETGMSLVRFRIWNQPRDENTGAPVPNVNGSMNPEDTLNKSLYANGLGMKVGLDFHYSDSWADPGKQVKPQGWKNLNYEELVEAVYNFTYDVTAAHIEAGVTPKYVQVGNEIINGMMWGNEKIATGLEPNYAKNDPSYFAEQGGELLWEYWNSADPEEQAAYDAAWDRFTGLVDAGLRAAKAASPASKTKIHVIVSTNRLAKTMEFWNQLTHRLQEDYNNSFDIMSISYYPEWHGKMSDLTTYLHAFATEFPDYELAISETSHPAAGGESATGYPNSVQGQADFMTDVMRACNDTINNACSTMLVWEPAIWQSMFTRIGNTDYWQANDSTRVFHEAYSKQILESNLYLTTRLYHAPKLPKTVRLLDVETNEVVNIAVTWDPIAAESYAALGSFTVTGTTASGKVTAPIAVMMDTCVLENLMDNFIKSKELSGPLVPQLTNSLKQVQHHWKKGSLKNAIKFVDQYLTHLNRASNDKHISPNARETLAEHARLLLEELHKANRLKK